MKEYNVGDTIYVKGKVKQLDKDGNIYCYQVYIADVGPLWVYNSDMVEKLPTAELVKPVLPKKVADELEIAKECKDSFDVYIMRIIIDHTTYENSHVFWSNSGDGVIKTLMDAWNNGYTVAKEKKYNLILGTDTDDGTNALFKLVNYNPCTDDALGLDADTYADDLKLDELYQFTQEEIDKYNNDFWIKNIDLNDYKIEVTDDDVKK